MNFQIGDVVRVGSRGLTGDVNGMGNAQQWQNSWIPEAMDANIGLTFTISDINDRGAFFEEKDSDSLHGGYGYPLNVLEPIELKTLVTEIY